MQAMAGTMWALGTANKAPAVSWWLSGGISAANCIAAYAPKGAASLAASYVNLANPGTYDAAPGNAPTWDVTNGWKFAATSSQYLTTGIAPTNDQTWSVLVRFSSAALATSVLFGHAATVAFQIAANYTGNVAVYSSGSSLVISSGLASGVLAFAGNTAYRNGSAESGVIPSKTGTFGQLFIGARSTSTSQDLFATANIQAFSIYNATLTAAQVLAVTNAMAAL